MSDLYRVFDFDRGISLRSALDIIAAALDDEGLAFVGRDNQGNTVGHGILEADRFRVIVPLRNIGRKVIG